MVSGVQQCGEWSLQDSKRSTTLTHAPTGYVNSATGETVIGHTAGHKLVVDVDLVADLLAADAFSPDDVRRIISVLQACEAVMDHAGTTQATGTR